MAQSEKLMSYIALAKLSYDQAVAFLLEKYGPVQDNYFKPLSYEHFLAGTSNNISQGNHSRGRDGLYTHHIQELNFPNISNQNAVRAHAYPFAYQEKSQLVYADLTEHMILHAIITAQTGLNDGLGFGGYIVISNQVKRWYINQISPTKDWQLPAYHHAYLDSNEAVTIVEYLEASLVKTHRQLQSLLERMYDAVAHAPLYQYPHIFSRANTPYEIIMQRLGKLKVTVPIYTDTELEQYIIKLLAPFKMTRRDYLNLDMAKIYDEARREDHDYNLSKTLSKDQMQMLHFYDEALEEDHERSREKQRHNDYAVLRIRASIAKHRHEAAKRYWIRSHQAVIKAGFSEQSPRDKILRALYHYADHNTHKNFKAYKSFRTNDQKSSLLDDLETYLEKDQHIS